MEALAFELCKFECDLQQVLRPTSVVYGDCLLQTAKSLFMICGNLFIDMTILGLDSYGDSNVAAALLSVAERLSNYLLDRAVLPFQARKPTIRLADVKENKIKLLGAFDITINETETLADVVAVHIARRIGTDNVEQPIILTSLGAAGSGTRTLSFLAIKKELENVEEEVSISISAAHPDTFHSTEKVVAVYIT